MWKALVGIVIAAVVGFLIIHAVKDEPQTVRTSIDMGVAQVKKDTPLDADQEHILRVQLALADYRADKGAFPETLEGLVPRYFDQIPMDSLTGQPYEYKSEGKSYRLGAQVSGSPVHLASAKEGGAADDKGSGGFDIPNFVNPNTMVEDPFVYDATGRRDPFVPFDFSQSTEMDETVPPLERYELGQLRVTAILTDSKGEMKAIVEDQQGRGYTVTKDSRIGKNNGTVISIEADRVNIVEEVTDFTGKLERKPVIMKIVNPADAKRKQERRRR